MCWHLKSALILYYFRFDSSLVGVYFFFSFDTSIFLKLCFLALYLSTCPLPPNRVAVASLTALLPLLQKLGAYDANQLSDELQHHEVGLNQVHKEAVRTST